MTTKPFSRLLRSLCTLVAGLAAAAAAQGAVIAVELSAFAGTTLVSFDEVAAGTSLTTQYQSVGVTNFNAEVLGASGTPKAQNFNMFLLPGSVSGNQLGSMGATIEFAAGVDRVGVWLYKHNGQQYLTALDASQNVLLSVADNAGSADSPYFDFVGIRSDSKNIRYVVISNKDLSVNPQWNVDGYATFFDDLQFTPITAVPEPTTWLLMLVSLVLMGLILRSRR